MLKPWPILLMVRELGIGGCERDLTKIAIGIDRDVFEPHVGCFIPEGFRAAELRDHGVPIVHIPVRSFRSPSAVRGASALRSYIRTRSIQLVHSYDVPMTVFGVPVARMSGTPVVISSQLSYRELAKPFVRPLLRVTDRLSDRIVVNCEAMREHLTSHENVPAEKTYLCYNGVDTSIFYPSSGDRLPQLQGTSLVIGTVCGLRREKRPDVLIDAFARVHHLLPGMKLAIVGSGVLRSSLERQAAALGVRDSCLFQPATSDVASWNRSMDIFVLPSESEAFSNALLEAMACGCCPVGTRVGGTPELIGTREERGLLFSSGDSSELAAKLEMLIRNAGLRQRYAAEAAQFASNSLNIAVNIRRMSCLYQSSIEQVDIKTNSLSVA